MRNAADVYNGAVANGAITENMEAVDTKYTLRHDAVGNEQTATVSTFQNQMLGDEIDIIEDKDGTTIHEANRVKATAVVLVITCTAATGSVLGAAAGAVAAASSIVAGATADTTAAKAAAGGTLGDVGFAGATAGGALGAATTMGGTLCVELNLLSLSTAATRTATSTSPYSRHEN